MELWVEKYRPKKLDDVFGQVEIVKRLKSFVKNKTMPHLLFSGPAGTGKTTCAMCLAREFFGEDWKSNFLETNASDERGIDVIRGKIKDFARTRPLNASFKIILLDEADALTKEAQQALRRTMEIYSSTCRFILSCNYSSKIIDPIQSRCAVFRFKPLKEMEVVEYLKEICSKENIQASIDVLKAIYKVSQGDLRKALNILQSSSSLSKDLTPDVIYEVASYARPDELKEVINYALNGNFIKAREKLLDVMLNYGLSGIDILSQMTSLVISLDIDEKLKVKIIDKIGECEFRLVEGSNEYIQLDYLLSQLCLIKNVN